jgi:hypothetical protein
MSDPVRAPAFRYDAIACDLDMGLLAYRPIKDRGDQYN